METQHKNILLTGEFQNIGFTFQVMKAAEELNICGYAVYQNSNTVKIEAEGKENDISEFVNWCKTGVPEAKISEINTSNDTVQDYYEFIINNNENIK